MRRTLLQRVRNTLRRIWMRSYDPIGYCGWDEILDAAERAMLRVRSPLLRGPLREIERLRRRYDGYRMHVETALAPIVRAIGEIDRVLGD